ncbi:amidase [Flagellatimonas centrodinii]|uniref:amidase n=1 Tax=Flagellatimonas centrodinii TaxID=2806210 RepID=UPI001FEEB227|nr:amidase [Flagellatimonas centrodinii]ULQ45538.1 amidase [Flagellatimonas centrodinii]
MTQHAFRDDALGDDDAVGLAARIASGEISAAEACEAAIARAEGMAALNAIAHPDFEGARRVATRPVQGVFAGVPTFIKDNVDVAGLPTGHGSAAVTPRPAKGDGPYVRQYRAQGFVNLGKSRLPEFGFNAATEFADGTPPTRNPWAPDYSPGASSGGAAALVASGVVPIAHANDGGGSIRIPAACCGLVGLKPTRGRHVDDTAARGLPINIISEGVVTRSVRDTAHFLAGMERTWRHRKLPPVGLVEGPGRAGLRIAMVIDSITGTATDGPTRAAVEHSARLLADQGHHIEAIAAPVPDSFPDDFTLYWGFLAFMLSRFGRQVLAPGFDARRIDPLSRGLAEHFARHKWRFPGTLLRLRRARAQYAETFRQRRFDVVLSPVLAHTPPRIGYLTPAQPFESLIERLRRYVAFTPLNNVAGSPAISLPMGWSAEGVPIGIQLQGAHGAERTLLELAYGLEAAQPFRRIQST